MLNIVNNCKKAHHGGHNKHSQSQNNQQPMSDQQNSLVQSQQLQHSLNTKYLPHQKINQMCVSSQQGRVFVSQQRELYGCTNEDDKYVNYMGTHANNKIQSHQKLKYINISINELRLSDNTNTNRYNPNQFQKDDRVRKISQQIAKNQLLSIDMNSDKHAIEKNHKGYNSKGKKCTTTHAYINSTIRNTYNSHSQSITSVNRSSKNKIVQAGQQKEIEKIDIIHKIYHKNISGTKNSQKQIYNINQKLKPCKQQENSRYPGDQSNKNIHKCYNANSTNYFGPDKPIFSYAHATTNRSLSNFQLLKLQAQDLQKSNIVLGVKQNKMNSNARIDSKGIVKNKNINKVCLKQYVKLQDRSEQNIYNNAKSTHRSRYKQSLTNRKLSQNRRQSSIQNENIQNTKTNRCRSKIMNSTANNMKKFHFKTEQKQKQRRLITQPQNSYYADTTIYKNNYNYDHSQCCQKSIERGNRVEGDVQENHTYHMKQIGLINKLELPQNKSQRCIHKTIQNNIVSYNHTHTNSFGRQFGNIKGKAEKKGTSQRINNNKYSSDNLQHQNSVCHCYDHMQTDSNKKFSINLKQQAQSQQEWVNSQEQRGTQHKRVKTYYQPHVQNQTVESNMNHQQSTAQYSNEYVINNQFIPLANRSVLDKKRHNIKKINKNINRLLAHRNNNNLNSLFKAEGEKNKYICKTQYNQNQEGVISFNHNRVNIDQFIKAKLNITSSNDANPKNLIADQQCTTNKNILSTKNIIQQMSKTSTQKERFMFRNRNQDVKTGNDCRNHNINANKDRSCKARNNSKSTSQPSLLKTDTNWNMNVTGNSITFKGVNIETKNHAEFNTTQNNSKYDIVHSNVGIATNTKTQNKNAARFYKPQLQKYKDKASIIYIDPHLKTKAIDIVDRDKKKQNNQIVIICL